MSPRSALLTLPIAAVLITGLTACSGGAAQPTSATPASAGPAAAPATATVAPAAAGPVDACKLVTAAAVSKVMGLEYVTAEARSQGGDSAECDYDTKGITLDHLTLEIYRSGGKDEANDDLQVIAFQKEKPITLTGIGDSAYEAPEGSIVRIEKAYGALWGDTYVTVGGPVKITVDQATQLMKAAHDALG